MGGGGWVVVAEGLWARFVEKTRFWGRLGLARRWSSDRPQAVRVEQPADAIR